MGMGKEIEIKEGVVELCREHDQVRTRAVRAAADIVGRTGCIRTSKGNHGEDSTFVTRTVDFRGDPSPTVFGYQWIVEKPESASTVPHSKRN